LFGLAAGRMHTALCKRNSSFLDEDRWRINGMVYISVQPAQHCSKATWINSLMVINTFVKQEGKKVIGKTY